MSSYKPTRGTVTLKLGSKWYGIQTDTLDVPAICYRGLALHRTVSYFLAGGRRDRWKLSSIRLGYALPATFCNKQTGLMYLKKIGDMVDWESITLYNWEESKKLAQQIKALLEPYWDQA